MEINDWENWCYELSKYIHCIHIVRKSHDTLLCEQHCVRELKIVGKLQSHKTELVPCVFPQGGTDDTWADSEEVPEDDSAVR